MPIYCDYCLNNKVKLSLKLNQVQQFAIKKPRYPVGAFLYLFIIVENCLLTTYASIYFIDCLFIVVIFGHLKRPVSLCKYHIDFVEIRTAAKRLIICTLWRTKKYR